MIEKRSISRGDTISTDKIGQADYETTLIMAFIDHVYFDMCM